MATDGTLERLTHSPKLGLYYRHIHDILEQEKQRRAEFYRSVREGDKAEFINGQPVFQSPVKFRHTETSKLLLLLLHTFVSAHDLGFVGHEKMLVSLTRNDYEPDLCYFVKAKAAQFTPEQMQYPAPDLAIEILSPSTEEVDRVIKFEDYAAHGVGEYWIVDPDTRTVEQFVRRGEEYGLVTKSRSGALTSAIIPGFEIPIRAIFDPAVNFVELQRLMGKITPD